MAKTGMSKLIKDISRRFSTALAHRASSQWHEPYGGLPLARNKPGLPAVGESIPELALPDELVLPLLDYNKQRVETHLQAGARVSVGDVLAPGVLAPASGVISAIEPRAVIHPSYQPSQCIVINVDQAADQNPSCLPAMKELSFERIERAGIKGLGGAGFDTASKLMAATDHKNTIKTLLVNAVECEPQISCDEALIRSDAHIIITAIHAMIELTSCERCIVAIEDDKTEAIAELERVLAIGAKSGSTTVPVELALLSAVYPSGAEKVLLQRIFGTLPQADQRASDLRVVCLNVATILAAWQAQSGHPMLSRIVTVAGKNPRNVRVRFGTSVMHLLQQTNNIASNGKSRVRAGGPLSGFDLKTLFVPISANVNCITVESNPQQSIASACIRCSQCSDVCPVDLLPQQIFQHASANDIPGALHFGLDACIECGCCDVVCPASIELTATFRHTRSAWMEQHRQKAAAELARQRFVQHEARLSEREREAQQIREQKKSQLISADDAIAQALARSRARKKRV